jgi:limonene-1,2-epoxide hydrolase
VREDGVTDATQTGAGRPLDATFGREARDRSADAAAPGLAGALAALETFYHAFNRRDGALLKRVWAPGPWIQLNNPLGGILRGIDPIAALYDRVFTGPARVWVEFHDVVAFQAPGMVTFAGRERGEFRVGDALVPLAIRTTRVFAHGAWDGAAPRWAQVHHHGSIDDPAALARYREAVRGGTAP